jgi:hypothetical protein
VRLAVLLMLAALLPARAAEFTTDHEGAPAITFVKLLRNPHDRDWWAWVTLAHEDWPIENRRFLLPEKVEYPDLREDTFWRHNLRDSDHVMFHSEEDHDKVYVRRRKFTAPYKHYVDWWVVRDPKGKILAKRDIEDPHPGGWPWTMLQKRIKIPIGVTQVTFQPHDKLHGYSPQKVVVDILTAKGPSYEVGELPLPAYSGRTGGAVKRYMRSNLAEEIPEGW